MRVSNIFKACVVAATTMGAVHANAIMLEQVTGTAGSSLLTISFSGTAVATGGSNYTGGIGWNFDPISFSPFPASISNASGDYGNFQFINGSENINNLTTGASLSITGTYLQGTATFAGEEGFGALIPAGAVFSMHAGDIIQWTGTGVIDISVKGLTFSNFNTGTTGDLVATNDPIRSVPLELQGRLNVSPVPEPATACLTSLGICYVMAKRRKYAIPLKT